MVSGCAKFLALIDHLQGNIACLNKSQEEVNKLVAPVQSDRQMFLNVEYSKLWYPYELQSQLGSLGQACVQAND